jgi:activator of HSP90 ATPase
MDKIIKQKIILNATPHQLYEAILNPRMHSQFTGAKATNTGKIGGKFTAYDGYAFGKNVKLEKDKKIVQSWSTTDFPDTFTEITFQFNKKGSQTELAFTQTGVPEKNYKEIAEGWKEFYWKPLMKMFG